MIIRKTNGEELTLRAKTEVSFEKIGIPGQRRWYAVFTPVALTRGGVGVELKIPVREVRSIKGGIRKAK